MRSLIAILILVILGLTGFIGYQTWYAGDDAWFSRDFTTTTNTEQDITNDVATTTDDMMDEEDEGPVRAIGTSLEDRDIMAYSYGSGDTELLFVGGIHGGYSWNTTVLMRELMDYLVDEEDNLPENVKVTVIPAVNPDGLYETFGTIDIDPADAPERAETVAGRFNANTVDLNRNFDCEWQPEAVWRDQDVDAGTRAFSEPEAQALRDYIEDNNPAFVSVYYSAAGGVYASSCRNGVSPETIELTNLYADEAGYTAHETFDFYDITGDAVNWIAKRDIPAISVLLRTHTNVEWEENKTAIEAVINYYADSNE